VNRKKLRPLRNLKKDGIKKNWKAISVCVQKNDWMMLTVLSKSRGLALSTFVRQLIEEGISAYRGNI
jgi:hypothetical protein